MRLAFINPQGNFDSQDSNWSAHPDFGGQLVYVKEVALACAASGHQVDIFTRQMDDPDWPEFAAPRDAYPGVSNVRIIRIPFGGPKFLNKEELWPFLGTEFVDGIKAFYTQEGTTPDAFTAHYGDGGISAAVLAEDTGIPFSFTAHSLGAQKMDKLRSNQTDLIELERRYHFARRIFAERIAMNHSAVIIVSTTQERLEQYSHPAYHGAINASDPKRFAVIPPGVNLSIFDHQGHLPGEEKTFEYIRQMFQRDLAPGRQILPAIVSSSRLDSKKNITGLVKAFAVNHPLQELANLVIFVRGIEDPLRDHSKSKFEEKEVLDEIVGMANEYQLWGKISAFPIAGQHELASAYRYLSRQFSVFSLTALYEPFGLAPLEAIAAGLPGVVTRNGGPSESLYDAESGKEYGVLINPVDPDDIGKGLLKLLSDRKTWEYYQEAGIQRVYDRYTWEQTAKSYLLVIQNMIEKPESTRAESLLQIPAFFHHPEPKNDIRIATLLNLFQSE